jgi:signal transduction histidine kinase
MNAYGFDALRLSQLRAVSTAFLRIRPVVVGPAMPCALLALIASGAPVTQIAVLGALFSIVLGGFVFEARRARRVQMDERWLFGSLMATLFAVCLGCALSGGIRSPMICLIFAPVVTLFAAFGRGKVSRTAFALAIGLGAALCALPKLRAFPAFAELPARIVTLAVLAVVLTLLYRSVSGLTDAYRHSAEELDRMRRAALDASAERMRNLEALAGGLAHELKNPLAAIKALSQLLARSQDTDRTTQRIGVLVSEIERMERILEEHLSFSRPLGELRRSAVDVGALVDEALSLFEGRASEAGVKLWRSGSGLKASADAGKLRDAIVNLVANALEATPRGGSVEVRLRASGDSASIEVVDSGRGMPPAVLQRIGTPFFTTRAGGTGLGVVMARGIAEQHGGSLAIESQAGRGTSARLSLPLKG